jgi:hypothetical protein
MSLLATVIIGAFVGVMAAYSGSEITQMSIETQLAAYGSVIAVLERILKTVYNYLENKEW